MFELGKSPVHSAISCPIVVPMNRAQRRLHSYRRPAAVGEAARTPGLVSGSLPIAEGAGVRFSVCREGFAAAVSMPPRPAGWVVVVGDAETPEGYATLRVERPDGEWREAVVRAVRWLSALPEVRGLPIAIAGAGEGRDAALAATAALGPLVAALVLDRDASGPVVLTPILVSGDPARVEQFLAAELRATPACALNHRQRRVLARRLERRMRRECRRRGALTGRIRAGIATLAAALAFTLGLGAIPDRAAAIVTSSWSAGTTQLTVTSDNAADGITLDCDTAALPLPRVEVNGATVTVTGDGGMDPGTLNCAEVGSITVSGQGGNDTINLTAVNQTDFINVQGHDVSLSGGANNDSITGSQVGDLLAGDAGNDTMNGQGASDTVDYSGSGSGVNVELVVGNATGQGTDSITGVENAIGSPQADTLNASSALTSLVGGDGDDIMSSGASGGTLTGGTGADSLLGNGNADTLLGDAGDDTLEGMQGSDSMLGGSENDTLIGGDGIVDTLDGGSGSADRADYSSAPGGGLDLDLGAQTLGGAETDSIAGFEQALGSSSPDTLTGSAAADTLLGQGEDDIIDGREGDDSLAGNNGADVIDGSHGNDTLMGVNGPDTLQGDPDATVAGGVGNDSIDGGSGGGTDDDLLVDEVRSVNGGIALNDTQASGTGIDQLNEIERASLTGNTGDNVLGASDGIQTGLGTEFSGPVTIVAGAGNDTVRGGLSDDSLDAGTGTDQVQQVAPGNQTLTPTQLSGVGDDALVSVNAASLRADNSGDESLDATAFNGPVTLFGSIGSNTLLGGSAGDSIRETGTATDSVAGNGGQDTVDYAGTAGPVELDLAAGTGTKSGSATDHLETVEDAIGTAAADTLVGDSLPNQLLGGGADDTLQGGRADDTLDGGTGTNTADYSDAPGGTGIDASLVTGTVKNASTDSLSGIQHLVGTSFDDTLVGDDQANDLDGAGGDDIFQGRGMTDTLTGGAGANTADFQDAPSGVDLDLQDQTVGGGADDSMSGIRHATGSQFADTLAGDANINNLGGAAGNDILQARAAADNLDGDNGSDTADLSDAPAGVNVNLATQSVSGGDADALNSIENAIGTDFDDTLTGDSGVNTLVGAGGNDVHNSQDSVADRNECGAGQDTANADAQDTNVLCETVNTPPDGGGGGGGGNPPPPPADTRAPVLTLSGDTKQKSKKVKVDATSDEASSIEVGGTIKVPKIKKAKGATAAKKKTYDLPVATTELAAGETETVTLKPAGKAKKALKKALKAGRKSTAAVTGTAADAAGNQGTDEFKVKVKKKRKK